MTPLENTVASFLDQLAGRQPTPGGGSASALGGALGAALGGMAAAYTVGNEKYARHEAAARAVQERLVALRTELGVLVAADMAAYDRYRQASSLPRATADEKRARSAALDAAREESTAVPEKMLAAAHAGLVQLDALTRAVNPNLAGDVASGAYFFEACARGAAIQIFANCAAADDAGANARRRAQASARVEACEALRNTIHGAVLKLMNITA
jgi:formiminotetrahydrofolate cyclodeaminase